MDQKPLIPRWAWTVLSAAVLAAVVALFLTGKPKEPGPSFRFDTSNFEKTGAAQKRFRETARFALDLANPTGLAATADRRRGAGCARLSRSGGSPPRRPRPRAR